MGILKNLFTKPGFTAFLGGKKKKKGGIKPEKFVSGYNSVKTANTDSSFGSSESGIDSATGQLYTRTHLSPSLQPAFDSASSGWGNSLGYISEDPSSYYDRAKSGQDPYYNVLEFNSNLQDKQNRGAAQLAASRGGWTNSNTLGSHQGMLDYLATQRHNQDLVTANQWGNEQARQNAAVQQSALNQMYGVEAGLGNQTNQNLAAVVAGQDAAKLFNIQTKYAADLANAQLQQAAAARQSATMGNLLNAGLTVGGYALGGPIGGMAGGALGSALGGGGSAQPSVPYVPKYGGGTYPITIGAGGLALS